jgi:hypothetical protein
VQQQSHHHKKNKHLDMTPMLLDEMAAAQVKQRVLSVNTTLCKIACTPAAPLQAQSLLLVRLPVAASSSLSQAAGRAFSWVAPLQLLPAPLPAPLVLPVRQPPQVPHRLSRQETSCSELHYCVCRSEHTGLWITEQS